MFPRNYFAVSYFAPVYWPLGADAASISVGIYTMLIGDQGSYTRLVSDTGEGGA